MLFALFLRSATTILISTRYEVIKSRTKYQVPGIFIFGLQGHLVCCPLFIWSHSPWHACVVGVSLCTICRLLLTSFSRIFPFFLLFFRFFFFRSWLGQRGYHGLGLQFLQLGKFLRHHWRFDFCHHPKGVSIMYNEVLLYILS